MGDKLYEENSVQAIAESIRSKLGVDTTYKINEMAGAINTIIKPNGTTNITENGYHDVTAYEQAYVYVEGGITPSGTINIAENGDYNVTDYAEAHVAVPQPVGKKTVTENGTDIDIAQYATLDVTVNPNVNSKTVNQNGVYKASDEGLDGYSQVTVSTPVPTGKKTITQNGTDIDVSSYALADVIVPQPSGKKTITQNGTDIDIFDYATADVQVNPNVGTKSININGVYKASDDNLDGYSQVTVNTPVPTGKKTITENGTNIDVAQYATADVQVDPNVGTKNITDNGTYTASSDSLDGYSSVTVQVDPNVGTKSIGSNGTYKASDDSLDGYSSVTVQVDPNVGTKTINVNGTYKASDDSLDGYSQVVVQTPVPTGTKQITANGTGIDVAAYATADVQVDPNVGTKSITDNGTYTASSDGLDGYSSVTVQVDPNVGTKTINANGTYNASSDSLDGYSSVTVNVPGSELVDRDKMIMPDKYNTGCHGALTNFDISTDTSGLLWQESGNDLKLDFNTASKKTIYNVNTSSPIIYKNVNFTQYESLLIANANMCSKSDQYWKAGVIIIFENCLFRKVNSAYEFASADMIQFTFIGCTIEMYKISNSYAERCLIGNKTFYNSVFGDVILEDGVKLFSYSQITDSYIMDIEPEVTSAGSSHFDGLQFTNDVNQTVLYNVRFECMNMPYNPKGGDWSYTAYYQGHATNSYLLYCTFHGGGYYQTAITKDNSFVAANNTIADGYSTPCYPSDAMYQMTDSGFAELNTKLYVSSLFFDGKDITIICTNDTTTAKTLTVKKYSTDGETSSNTTFNIPASPSRDSGWSGITSWNDLPFDVPCVIHDAYNISKIECYDGDTKIRTWYVTESHMPIDVSAYLTITSNGTYNTEDKAGVIVNVPSSVSGTIEITQNGTGIDVGQYQYADVAVPGIVPTGTYPVTENGTYDITNYANVSVNVSGGGGGLPANMTMTTVNISSDATSFTTSYDTTKTVEMVMVIPLILQGTNYEQTFLVGKMNFLTGSFDQYAGTTINYNSTTEQIQTAANAGSMSFSSGTLTVNTRSSSYKFKAGNSYSVLIVYSAT